MRESYGNFALNNLQDFAEDKEEVESVNLNNSM